MSLPWLSQPVQLHSSRDPGECTMTPEQCAYKTRYWVYWYEADHRFGLPTVAFFVVAIILFAFVHALSLYTPKRWQDGGTWRRISSLCRLLSYTSWRLGNWNTRSLGAYMLGAVGLIFFFAMMLAPQPYYWPNTKELSYGNSPPIATRSGWMAVACMPFLLLLSTKANPIATLVGSSHEKLIVWHNWVAWIFLVLALVHTFPFVVYHIWMGDIVTEWNKDGLWVTGVIALLAQAWLTFMSIRQIRERFYEFFKATHFFFAVVFVVFFFLHCDFILTSWDYFIAAGVLYCSSWLYSQCRVYLQHGFKHRARLYPVTSETLMISIDTNARWQPGQHIYLRFLALGVHSFTAHPFTICSSPRPGKENQMVFYVKQHGGLTGRLMKLGSREPGTSIPVMLDGPYGGIPSRWFEGFDRTVVLGGGSGASFSLALADHFLEYTKTCGTGAATKMTLIVSSRDNGFRDWFLEALGKLALRDSGDEKQETSRLSVHIHETGHHEGRPSTTDEESQTSKKEAEELVQDEDDPQSIATTLFNVQFFKERPNIPALAGDAAATQDASVGLAVCGPSSMAHDIGQVAAAAQRNILKGGRGAKEVFFHTESFSS